MANRKPDAELAQRVLPPPLVRALAHVFSQRVRGVMLVGGTALAGYYAGHRRSDDLDLFVRDRSAQQATVLAVASLTELSASVDERQRTPQFYDVTCELEGHVFTAQVVLDPTLFAIGASQRASDGVLVADLPTLLKQKAATLVSRCSEKDLYDLIWLFGVFPELQPRDLIALGSQIDSGMTAEAVMLSLTSATLRQSACHFSSTQGAREVHRDIVALKQELARAFHALARKQPVPRVGQLIKALRKPR